MSITHLWHNDDGFANAKILILKQITTAEPVIVNQVIDGFADAKILILKQITTR